jgi:pimeloyl-ACP methyl ester carboxylesterase
MLRTFLIALLLPLSANATERWQTLPPTPAPIADELTDYAAVNGIRLYYATIGTGPPVVLLHGGLANSDYWGNQVAALKPGHRVILVDSRGHGRSTRDERPFGYDLMADDVVALLDTLKLDRADIVGWSDGGIIGLDLAMRYPQRVRRVFAFGANSLTSGVKFAPSPVFDAFTQRARSDYVRLSTTPDGFDSFVKQISGMWQDQPNWTDDQLRTITAPVQIVDGDHDEAIKRDHTEYLAATIPHAGLLILPNASHFAFLQDPALFNAAMLDFLDGQPD